MEGVRITIECAFSVEPKDFGFLVEHNLSCQRVGIRVCLRQGVVVIQTFQPHEVAFG